jgi:uncharacterized protein YecT (DUF1311 family)
MHPMPPIHRHPDPWASTAVLTAWLLAGALACLPARAADPAAASTSANASPATPPSSAAHADPCLDAADEPALLACRKSAHADATRALRQAVDKLQQRLHDDAPEQLRLFNTAQRAWRRYSQAECRFRLRESVGGAAYPASLLSCATDMSRQRLQALQTVIARP